MSRTSSCLAFTTVVFACGLVATGCSGPSSQNTGVAGTIVLIDTPDNGMTTVSLFTSGATVARATTTTDPTGAFRFPSLAAGTYRLHAEHDTYDSLDRDGIVVSDSQNGVQNLGALVMSRLGAAGAGSAITAGNPSPDGTKRLFRINDLLNIYDQTSGLLTPLPVDYPFVGGIFSVDDKVLLAKVPNAQPNTSADLGADLRLPDFGIGPGGPTPSTGQSAIYMVPVDGSAPPQLISLSTLTAGVGASSQFGFVIVPAASGSTDAGDIYTFPLGAAAVTPTAVGVDVQLSTIIYLPHDANDNLGVYSQLVFLDNHVQAGGRVSYDWSVLDLSTGQATLLVAGVDSNTVTFQAADGSSQPTYVLLHEQTGGVGPAVDVYTFQPGAPAATKVGTFDAFAWDFVPNDASLSKGYLFNDLASVAATDVYFLSTATGVAPKLIGRFSGSITASDFGYDALRLDPDHLYTIGQGTSATVFDLDEVTLSTGAVAVVQPALTQATGTAMDWSATLYAPSVAQIFTESAGPPKTRLVVNIGADGTNLTPVVIDENGAHMLPSPIVASAFGTFAIGYAGNTAAFLDNVNGVGVVGIPATANGDATLARVPATQNTAGRAVAVSPKGEVVGMLLSPDNTGLYYYTVGSGSSPSAVNGTLNILSPVQLVITPKLAVIVQSGGGTLVMNTTTGIPTGTAAPDLFNGSVQVTTTANDEHIALFQSGQLFDYASDGTIAPAINTAYAGGMYAFAARTRIVITPQYQFSFSPIRIIEQATLDGTSTSDTSPGYFSPFFSSSIPGAGFARSPDGDQLYFYDGASQRAFAVGAGGSPSLVGPVLQNGGNGAVHPMGADELELIGYDPVTQQPTLFSLDRDTSATKTLSRSILVPDAPGFSSTSAPSALPWFSADGAHLYYFSHKDAAAMTPASTQLFGYAPGAAPVVLGDGTQLSPLPTQVGNDIELRTQVASLTGTATLTVLKGGVTPVVVAQNVRSAQLSPDGMSRAATLLDGGALSFASGPKDGPLVTMGPVQFFDLGENLAWGSKELYVIDRVTGAGDSHGGTLYAGSIGQTGLIKVAAGVIAVYPDATGDQAAVISTDGTASGGLVLGRFSFASTQGM